METLGGIKEEAMQDHKISVHQTIKTNSNRQTSLMPMHSVHHSEDELAQEDKVRFFTIFISLIFHFRGNITYMRQVIFDWVTIQS